MLLEDVKAFEGQVDNILKSEELRGCQVLCRLFRFLAEKTACGEADQLKEYTVAVEGLGRPSSYDPRLNSTVRIQAARLRQKLAAYYRTEGRNDEVLIELPRGHFKLTFVHRTSQAGTWSELGSGDYAEELGTLGLLPSAGEEIHASKMSWLPWALLVAAVMVAGYFAWQVRQADAKTLALSNAWNPALEELWLPIVSSKHTTILVIEDPLFIQFRGDAGMFYRDRTLNQWSAVASSPQVTALQSTLSNKEIETSRYYTAFGEVDASILLARLLSSRISGLPVVKSSQLSWRQLADNNILFVGVQNLFFDEKLQGLPLHPQLVPSIDGVRNLNPQPGEDALYVDRFQTSPSQSGAVYALVTCLPGPVGSHEIESFTSNRSAGYVAAIQAFTDPRSANMIAEKLKQAARGHIPRYYQVLFKVDFKDDVPTGINVVLGRELQ
jgi:hypothetical protein